MNKSYMIKINYSNNYVIKIHVCNIHFREWNNVSQMNHMIFYINFVPYIFFIKYTSKKINISYVVIL